jgi:hypothetical protein
MLDRGWGSTPHISSLLFSFSIVRFNRIGIPFSQKRTLGFINLMLLSVLNADHAYMW